MYACLYVICLYAICLSMYKAQMVADFFIKKHQEKHWFYHCFCFNFAVTTAIENLSSKFANFSNLIHSCKNDWLVKCDINIFHIFSLHIYLNSYMLSFYHNSLNLPFIISNGIFTIEFLYYKSNCRISHWSISLLFNQFYYEMLSASRLDIKWYVCLWH